MGPAGPARRRAAARATPAATARPREPLVLLLAQLLLLLLSTTAAATDADEAADAPPGLTLLATWPPASDPEPYSFADALPLPAPAATTTPSVLFTLMLPKFSAPAPGLNELTFAAAGGGPCPRPWSNVGGIITGGGGGPAAAAATSGDGRTTSHRPLILLNRHDAEDAAAAGAGSEHSSADDHDGAVLVYAGRTDSAAALLHDDDDGPPPPPARVLTAADGAAFARTLELFLAPGSRPGDPPPANVTLLDVRQGMQGAWVSASVEIFVPAGGGCEGGSGAPSAAGLAAFLAATLASDPALVFPTSQWGETAVIYTKTTVATQKQQQDEEDEAATPAGSDPAAAPIPPPPPPPPPPPQTQYAWKTGEYGPCSALCGEEEGPNAPVQRRRVTCVDALTGAKWSGGGDNRGADSPPSPSPCARLLLPRPASERPCNVRPCDALAPRASAWAGGGAWLVARLAAAEDPALPPPPLSKLALAAGPTPPVAAPSSSSSYYNATTGAWLELGTWGPCLPPEEALPTCGEGEGSGDSGVFRPPPAPRRVRVREARVCRLAGGAFVADMSACGGGRADLLSLLLWEHCDSNKEEACGPRHRWVYGPWSACPAAAEGEGCGPARVSTRAVRCVRASDGRAAAHPGLCDARARAETSRPCPPCARDAKTGALETPSEPPPLPYYYWRAGELGDCEPLPPPLPAAVAPAAAAAEIAAAAAAPDPEELNVTASGPDASIENHPPTPATTSRRRRRAMLEQQQNAPPPCRVASVGVAWRKVECADSRAPPGSPAVAARLCSGQPWPEHIDRMYCKAEPECEEDQHEEEGAAAAASNAKAAVAAVASAALTAGVSLVGAATSILTPLGQTVNSNSDSPIVLLESAAAAALLLDDRVAAAVGPAASDAAAAAVLRASGGGGAARSRALLSPSCPPGRPFSANGTCCASEGDSVDKLGACCSGGVDACGVCSGGGVAVDALGACCGKGGRLDARGMCCPAGETVDECGVCGGTSRCELRAVLVLEAGMAVVAQTGDGPLRSAAQELAWAALRGSPPQASRLGSGSSSIWRAASGPDVLKALGSPELRREQVSVAVVKRREDGHGNGDNKNATTDSPALVVLEVAVSSDKEKEKLDFPSTARALLLLQALEGVAVPLPLDNGAGSTSAPPPLVIASVRSVLRAGTCGDGMCQLNERPAPDNPRGCPADCGYPYLTCPPFPPPAADSGTVTTTTAALAATDDALPPPCHGVGVCHAHLGACACFEGYAGSDCANCAPGYRRVAIAAGSSTGGRPRPSSSLGWSCVSARALLVRACAEGRCALAPSATDDRLDNYRARALASALEPQSFAAQRAGVLGVLGTAVGSAAVAAAAVHGWQRRRREAQFREYLRRLAEAAAYD